MINKCYFDFWKYFTQSTFQVKQDIRSLTTLNLVPICQVQYHRAYLENRDGARATIDSRICYSRVTNQFKIIEPFFFDSYNILELKTTNPTLSQTLAGENHLPIERFSKYCRSIEKIFNFQV